MASSSSVVGASDDTRFQFAQNEAVLVKDTTGLLEEALILNRRMEDDKPSYFVKFARWEDKWNRWVDENTVLKRSAENCLLRDSLRRENFVRISAATRESHSRNGDGDGDNGDGEAQIVTLAEVLDSQQYLEDEALSSVSNAEQERTCTFSRGYHRQLMFACKECTERAGREFGFCYACSMQCHVDHTVYELFHKRKQRCDCGTQNSHCCECIIADQDTKAEKARTANTDNKYGHNYRGLYCWCNQPYDHDCKVDMFQCVCCEDWFHEKCLNSKSSVAMPDTGSFCDLVCAECTAKHPWFRLFVAPAAGESAPEIAATSTSTSTTTSTTTLDATVTSPATSADVSSEVSTGKRKRDTDCPDEHDHKRPRLDDGSTTPANTDSAGADGAVADGAVAATDSDAPRKLCIAEHLQGASNEADRWNAYLPAGWRSSVCDCVRCHQLLTAAGLEFLLLSPDDEDDEDDEVDIESLDGGDGHEAAASVSLERSFQQSFVQMFAPTQQRALLGGFQLMMERVKERLGKFAETGRVVTRQDIDEIFRELQYERMHGAPMPR